MMNFIRIAPGHFESTDGRFVVLRDADGCGLFEWGAFPKGKVSIFDRLAEAGTLGRVITSLECQLRLTELDRQWQEQENGRRLRRIAIDTEG